jgi:Zn finger protein HypA/HybF involved in hydrogenase expression
VLPTDEKLEREYKSERNVEVDSKTAKLRVNCKHCGAIFSANSNRQKYCDKCRDKNENEKSKLRMRQMRKSRLDVTL